MANNQNVQPVSFTLSVQCSHPTTPASGDPVRLGKMTGVALTAESAGGNASGYTSVDFSEQVVSVSVYDEAGTTIAIGDKLYYTDADSASSVIGNNSGGQNAVWGYALEAVTTGVTKTIKTWHATP
jgi:predicted RecA/RadA family phage recombinase